MAEIRPWLQCFPGSHKKAGRIQKDDIVLQTDTFLRDQTSAVQSGNCHGPLLFLPCGRIEIDRKIRKMLYMFRILRFLGECVNKKERSSDSDFHTIFNISYGVKKADRMDRIAEKRYNDCAKRNPARFHRAAPLRGDYTGNPRLVEKMPPAASLSPLRTGYNDCAKRNPARFHRAAPLRGDYTGNPRLAGKMPPVASLSPLRTWYNDFAQYDSGKAW